VLLPAHPVRAASEAGPAARLAQPASGGARTEYRPANIARDA
jgi:hypothetical protein